MKKSILFLIFIVSFYMSSFLGSSSSSNSSSSDYVVLPPDNNPSMGYDDGSKSLVSLMKNLTSQGYTSISYGNNTYLDNNLYSKSGYVGKQLGYYQANGNYTPSRLRNQNAVADVLTQGVYKINKDALVKAIGKGKFFNKDLMYRLLVEEFFFGQLIVSTGPFWNKSSSLSVNSVLQNGSKSWQTTLTRLRFIRNALEAKNSSGTFTIGQNPSFSPVDFFVGIMLINNSSTVFQSGKIGIRPGNVGFFPIDSSAMMNKWSSVYTDDSDDLPTRAPMQFGIMGQGQHSFNLQPLPQSDTVQINLAGIKYGPGARSSSASLNERYFSTTMMKKFFQDVGPWALVVEVEDGKNPEVTNLIKLCFADFCPYLQITDSTGTYNFLDIFMAPFNAYLNSYLHAKTSRTKRLEVTSGYPIQNWLAQGFLNGILESSTYQTLAGSSTNKQIDCGPVTLNQWHPAPYNCQMLCYGSGHDFLFLRALRITRALQFLKGISYNLINNKDSKGKSLLLQALAQPTKNITYQGETVYIAGNNGKGSNTYIPILPVLPYQAPKTLVQKTKPKKSPITVSTPPVTAPQSISKGSTTSTGLGSTLKTSTRNGSRGAQKRPVNGQGQSSNASVEAYKQGYQVGQAIEAYKQGYKKGMQSFRVNN